MTFNFHSYGITQPLKLLTPFYDQKRCTSMSKNSRKRTEKNPFVPTAVCEEKHAAISKEITSLSSDIQSIKKALIGEDLQSGLVKEISEMKNKMRTQSTVWDFLKPIIVAILSATITAYVLSLLHW